MMLIDHTIIVPEVVPDKHHHHHNPKRRTTASHDKDQTNQAQKIKEGWQAMFLVIPLTANVAVNAIRSYNFRQNDKHLGVDFMILNVYSIALHCILVLYV